MSSPWLAPATLRNLADKLYEKRKAAALEVEQVRVRGALPQVVRACVRAKPDMLANSSRQPRRWQPQGTLSAWCVPEPSRM